MSSARPIPVPERHGPERSRLMLVLGIVAVVVALVAGAASAWLLLGRQPAEATAKSPAHVVKTGTLVVNIADTDGRRYLRATLELGTAGPKDGRRLEEFRAPILDAAIDVLGGTALETLLDAAQREELKSTLRTRVNEIVGGQPVTHVYLTEFVIQ